jgi:SepF-like predicted cell division protein (DUF552 family)
MTPYSNIYNRFLRKISDYRLTDQTFAETNMLGWLQSAIVKFTKCRTNLSDRDDTLQQFNQTLSEYEEEILASLMVIEWFTPEVNDVLAMKNLLSDTDFKIYSTANLLKQKQDLLEEMIKQVNSLMVNYWYDTIDISDFS